MPPSVSVIIVTHNDIGTIHRTLDALFLQTKLPKQIILVDSGSKDPSFLFRYHGDERIETILSPTNIGFTGGNNLGFLCTEPDSDYVLFLNPDVFLEPDYVEKAVDLMEQNRNWGGLTGMLLGYDFYGEVPTGKYDSTGIFHTWYGHWFDRGQREEVVTGKYDDQEEVPAICGAAQFCRKQALVEVQSSRQEIYDPTFFMYKEDIDLSIRLRQKGWSLMYCPRLKGYHCRGWNSDRSRVPRALKLLSAKNELKVHFRSRSWVGMGYSLTKYLAVYCLNV